MDTFLALLKSLSDAGIDPSEAAIHATPNGAKGHEMTIRFHPDDQASADDFFDEIQRLGLEGELSGDGLSVTAGLD